MTKRLRPMQRFADACLAASDLDGWMRAMADAALPIVEREGLRGVGFTIQTRRGHMLRSATAGVIDDLAARTSVQTSLTDDERATTYAPFTVSLLSKQFGLRSMLESPMWLELWTVSQPMTYFYRVLLASW